MRAAILAVCVGLAQMALAQLHISTAATSLVLDGRPGEKLGMAYYGPAITDADADAALASEKIPEAYPVYGMDATQAYSLAVTHANGSLATDVRVKEVKKEHGADGSEVTRVILADTLYPFFVDLCYRTWPDCDVIETWAEIYHKEKGPVVLREYASASLPVRRGNVWLSHISGAWGNEGVLTHEALAPGVKSIRNHDGIRNSQASHAELMLSLDGRPDERQGRTIGAALLYTGNYLLSIDTDTTPWHRFNAGIDPANSSYTLPAGERFITPALDLTYSSEGTSGVSRNLHRWGRRHRLMRGDTVRPVLLNSWEGVYFDVSEPVLEAMMADFSEMGGELFVLDDGWFGDKYPRDNDKSGLGDWVVNTRKLPNGLNGLLKSADDKGLKFGIWIEPEMVSLRSELYEKHPDWLIQAPGREHRPGRGGTQLVLDLGKPDVQEYVFDAVDCLLAEYPQIGYVKWDANMVIRTHGVHSKSPEDQAHLFVNYHRGLDKVLSRLREKYPDVMLQACGAGGGRANWGALQYADELWVSDNTDPYQRVYAQWATSYFFPAIAMAQHISASPCHASHRATPIKYRTDVAMSGRLGLELQPSQMTAEEREFCRKAIATYKQIRPTIHLGEQYRLHSPFDGDGVAALMYVDEARDEAVYFWYMTDYMVNRHYPRITMQGLDPEKIYKVTELNRIDNTALPYEGKSFSGAYLMANGLEMPSRHDASPMSDWSSRVLLLKSEK